MHRIGIQNENDDFGYRGFQPTRLREEEQALKREKQYNNNVTIDVEKTYSPALEPIVQKSMFTSAKEVELEAPKSEVEETKPKYEIKIREVKEFPMIRPNGFGLRETLEPKYFMSPHTVGILNKPFNSRENVNISDVRLNAISNMNKDTSNMNRSMSSMNTMSRNMSRVPINQGEPTYGYSIYFIDLDENDIIALFNDLQGCNIQFRLYSSYDRTIVTFMNNSLKQQWIQSNEFAINGIMHKVYDYQSLFASKVFCSGWWRSVFDNFTSLFGW